MPARARSSRAKPSFDADAARSQDPDASVRHRRTKRSDARRNRQAVLAHARAHPADRSQGAAEATPPHTGEGARFAGRQLSRTESTKAHRRSKRYEIAKRK